ncbi:MAG: type IX secretion system protein PorQ [Prevotella sp.]|nr:type IX secretion system protein PorQ [Prevotella sp.]
MNIRNVIITIILAFWTSTTGAQESETAYNFLRLPVSAHVAALGGENISLTEDDASLIFHNPALISRVSDKSINLNYMTYMQGAKNVSASFVKLSGKRASWGVTAQLMDYGDMKHTTIYNEDLGNFSARDIAIGGTFAYELTDRISGGISAKFITSTIADYNSLAVGVDLGINYLDASRGWSFSAVARNLGGQIDAYDDEFERIPFDLQVGASKRLLNSPFRFHATLSRLTDWEEGIGRHLAIGADVLIGDNIYLAAGYNFRKAQQMKISDEEGSTAHGAGFSLGAGLSLQRFKLHLGWGKYHVSTSSLLINISYAL